MTEGSDTKNIAVHWDLKWLLTKSTSDRNVFGNFKQAFLLEYVSVIFIKPYKPSLEPTSNRACRVCSGTEGPAIQPAHWDGPTLLGLLAQLRCPGQRSADFHKYTHTHIFQIIWRAQLEAKQLDPQMIRHLIRSHTCKMYCDDPETCFFLDY